MPPLNQACRAPEVTTTLAAAMRTTTSAVRAALGRLDINTSSQSLEGRVSKGAQGENPIGALAQSRISHSPPGT